MEFRAEAVLDDGIAGLALAGDAVAVARLHAHCVRLTRAWCAGYALRGEEVDELAEAFFLRLFTPPWMRLRHYPGDRTLRAWLWWEARSFFNSSARCGVIEVLLREPNAPAAEAVPPEAHVSAAWRLAL